MWGSDMGDPSFPFTLNKTHYTAFLELAHQTGWPAAKVPSRFATHIGAPENIVESLPNEQVNREDLKALAADTDVSSESLFLAIMAWGGMKVSHGRLAWDLRDEWVPIMDQIRAGELSRTQSYERFRLFRERNPRCGFGPAYYTKAIFFADPKHDGYIMDQWTSKSVNLLLRTGDTDEIVHLTAGYVSDRNGSDKFERYCRGVEFLTSQQDLQDAFSGEAKITPEEVEMRLFSFGGRNPGNWREYVRRNG